MLPVRADLAERLERELFGPAQLSSVEGVMLLRALKADPRSPEEIFRRLTQGETLREIAAKLEVQFGMLTRWFMEEHGELFDAAERVRANDLKEQALENADAATPEDVAPRKLRVDTRMRLIEKMDRVRYGAKDTGPAGGIQVFVDRSCGGAVQVGLKDAGGNVAAVRIDGAEALAAGASAPVLGKMEI